MIFDVKKVKTKSVNIKRDRHQIEFKQILKFIVNTQLELITKDYMQEKHFDTYHETKLSNIYVIFKSFTRSSHCQKLNENSIFT